MIDARRPHPDIDPDGGISLSCRHLWKIYGPREANALALASEDGPGVGEIVERLRQAGNVPAVCEVSFGVRRGEILVVMGLSGSGKSTVVRCLSRLVEPTSGQVIIDGRDLLAL